MREGQGKRKKLMILFHERKIQLIISHMFFFFFFNYKF